MNIPAHLVERFRADFRMLALPEGRIGIAVSGGPDSLALLLLARAAFGEQIWAATVDHGLRAESREEAMLVARLCTLLPCPHAILPVDVAPGGEGLQGEARRARYAALRHWAEEHDVGLLCTAHHADDQAETLLMRLQRGAGLSGLSGIRPLRAEGPHLQLLRPLLGWRKSELTDVLVHAGVTAADDPSNRDGRFDRTAVRRLLADHPAFESLRLARTAGALREANEAIEWTAQRLWRERATFADDEWCIDPDGLPREFTRRLLSRAIADLHDRHPLTPPWRGSEDVEGLLTALEGGQTATLAGIVASGGPQWRIRVAPPRRRLRDKIDGP